MSQDGYFDYELQRGEKFHLLTIDYVVADYYPETGPDFNGPGSPAEGGEIEELTITCEGKPFTLTLEEEKAIEDRIYETHEYY